MCLPCQSRDSYQILDQLAQHLYLLIVATQSDLAYFPAPPSAFHNTMFTVHARCVAHSMHTVCVCFNLFFNSSNFKCRPIFISAPEHSFHLSLEAAWPTCFDIIMVPGMSLLLGGVILSSLFVCIQLTGSPCTAVPLLGDHSF